MNQIVFHILFLLHIYIYIYIYIRKKYKIEIYYAESLKVVILRLKRKIQHPDLKHALCEDDSSANLPDGSETWECEFCHCHLISKTGYVKHQNPIVT